MRPVDVQAWAWWTAEAGPPSLDHLPPQVRTGLGRSARACAAVLGRLADGTRWPLSELTWVCATAEGDPTAVQGDPHHALERELSLALGLTAPSITVTAGAHTVAAGLLEAQQRISAGHRGVVLIVADMVAGAELVAGFVLGASEARFTLGPLHASPAAEQRHATSGPGVRFARNPSVSALVLAQAMDRAGTGQEPLPIAIEIAPARPDRDAMWIELSPSNRTRRLAF